MADADQYTVLTAFSLASTISTTPLTLKIPDRIERCKVSLYCLLDTYLASHVHRILEAAAPLPNRAKRLQDATNEVKNLYERHAAQDNSASGRVYKGFKPVSLNGALDDQLAGFDRRKIGVPLSREVLEGKGVGREPGPDGTAKSWKYSQEAVDARALSMRPSDRQGPLVSPRARKPRPETIGLSEKSRFPSRQQKTEDQVWPRDPRPQFPRPQVPRPQVPRPQRSGARGNQGDGEGGGRKPRRGRGGGAQAGSNNSTYKREQIWTEEELEYLKEKKKREMPQSVNFQPVDISRETLSGSGPAMASGEWGMGEMLGKRLLLAKKTLNREFVQWDSKEQKADVLTLVHGLKGTKDGQGEEKNKEDEQASKPMASDPQTQALMQKLLGGSYAMVKPRGEQDILGHIARHADRNESYFPVDGKSLLNKVRSILPAEQKPGVAKTG